MNPQKKKRSIPKSNQTNSKMPYPIPLSSGHSNNQKKKKKPNLELREDDPPRSTKKTRSLALAAMARERGDKREERGLVR